MQTNEAAEGWLATDDYGVIEQLEHESIVTSFYRMVFPIWPEHSAYVIRAADGTEQRIPIPLQRKSVLLGYLRVYSWFATLFFAAPALFAWERFAWMGPIAIVLLACSLLVTFLTGRLDDAEAYRRNMLRRVVGFGAPPELLSESFRAEIRVNLELMWATKSQTPWADALAAGECSELLVALAEYHQDPELIAIANANFSNHMWN
ncbi:MAG: hypothetical protein H0T46_32545 [Deltaproteobacteria bacterium]|nr:hypothetical protein [Deltaproteobacteria bacterium]